MEFEPDEKQEKALKQLKSNLRETTYPLFEDESLINFLIDAEWDVNKASYNALIEKAENDDITLPSGLKLPNNRKYWLSLARRYRKNCGGAKGREV